MPPHEQESGNGSNFSLCYLIFFPLVLFCVTSALVWFPREWGSGEERKQIDWHDLVLIHSSSMNALSWSCWTWSPYRELMLRQNSFNSGEITEHHAPCTHLHTHSDLGQLKSTDQHQNPKPNIFAHICFCHLGNTGPLGHDSAGHLRCAEVSGIENPLGAASWITQRNPHGCRRGACYSRYGITDYVATHVRQNPTVALHPQDRVWFSPCLVGFNWVHWFPLIAQIHAD